MRTFAFEVAHGYEILRCVADVENKKDIIDAVNNETFQNLNGFDCIDTFDSDVLTEGYDLLDVWE